MTNSEQIDDFPITMTLIGSSVVEGVKPNDEDWLVEIPWTRYETYKKHLKEEGFVQEGNDGYPVRSIPFRKGKLNYIIVTDPVLAEKWKLANEVVKKLQLKNRNDRITVYKAVRDGILG